MGKFQILILFCVIAQCACGEKTAENQTTLSRKDFPDQEGWESTLTATSNGKITATIQYGYMQRYNKKKIVYFDEGIEVNFYDDDGNHTSKLTSDKGTLDENINRVQAYDNVVVISDSGITLETENIWWDNQLEKVISDQFVTITTSENDTLYGVGFESDQNLTNWMIKEPRGKTDKKFNLDFDTKSSSGKDSTNLENESTSED